MKKIKVLIILLFALLVTSSQIFAQKGKQIYHPPTTVDNRPSLPDLIISSFVVTSKTATSISFNYTIKNIGTKLYEYKQASISYYFSNDDVINFAGNNPDNGRRDFSNMADHTGFTLAPSEQYQYHGTFSVTGSFVNYQYCMLRIDHYNTEANNDNNVFRLYIK